MATVAAQSSLEDEAIRLLFGNGSEYEDAGLFPDPESLSVDDQRRLRQNPMPVRAQVSLPDAQTLLAKAVDSIIKLYHELRILPDIYRNVSFLNNKKSWVTQRLHASIISK